MHDTLPRGIKKRFKRNKNSHYDIRRKIVSLKEWKTGSGFKHSQRRF